MQIEQFAKAYGAFYERLTPETPLEEYAVFFDKKSSFSDPFQSVEGLLPIHNVFLNMYKTLHNPHFLVDEIVTKGDVAYLKWRFTYALKENATPQSFSGLSRVVFTASAKVLTHEDFWDAAHNVYEKIPLLGGILRFIKRRLHAG